MPDPDAAPQPIDGLLEGADRLADAWLDDLMDLSRLRSRREEPEGMLATADWVAARLQRLGASVERVGLDGAYPYVLGELAADRADAPVLPNFNHYDVEVEPPGPDEAWTTPPCEPTVRDGRLYARGIADDKAALLSRIHAAELLEATGFGRPVHVRFLMEGKRTLGRPILGDLVAARPDWVACDGALWENSWTDLGGAPVLKFGEKGLRRGEPEQTSTSTPFGRLVIDTARAVHGFEPVTEPCSIWIGTRALVAALGTPVVGVGIGRPDASIDGPDEHIRLADYQLGVAHVAAVMLGMEGMRR
jgi:acetylornithine deacetylase/succinyl-diaminopimelate desuccinylase-like protein